MVATTNGADATSANFSALASLPAGTQVAGYSTGSDGIEWTAAQWAEYPNALRIDQDAAASDHTADYLDVETGAATVADCPGWVTAAQASFTAGTRPGQRTPAIYCDEENVTPVVNELTGAGITSGVGLVVANWSYTEAQAVSVVEASSGPFPIVGVQYSDEGGGGAYDLDIYLTSWLDNVSKEPNPVSTPVAPPGQWLDAASWTWVDCVITGLGEDGNLYAYAFDPTTGDWIELSPFAGESRV